MPLHCGWMKSRALLHLLVRQLVRLQLSQSDRARAGTPGIKSPEHADGSTWQAVPQPWRAISSCTWVARSGEKWNSFSVGFLVLLDAVDFCWEIQRVVRHVKIQALYQPRFFTS